MDIKDICVECGAPEDKLDWLGRCPSCFEQIKMGEKKATVNAPYFKEMGVENPIDPKGSTAHVRDIKNRRYDAKADKQFQYKPPKKYFFGG